MKIVILCECETSPSERFVGFEAELISRQRSNFQWRVFAPESCERLLVDGQDRKTIDFANLAARRATGEQHKSGQEKQKSHCGVLRDRTLS
jgi:hypothetical protein